jgi:hypothetical protein
MTPRTQPTDIVDACTQWVTSSIDAWATSAAATVEKIQSGAYGPADWYADATAYAGQMAQAAVDLFGSIVSGTPETKIVSEDYTAPAAKAYLGVRTLRIGTPLQATMTQTTISATAVTIVPSTLPGGATTFHLEIDPTNLPGDAYLGTVEVVLAGAVTDSLDVVVQVP